MKLLASFIRDKLVFTVGFFLNSLFLIIFFFLSTGERVEMLYPLLLTFTVYVVALLAEWSRYYGFNKNLEHCLLNPGYELKPNTAEQTRAAETIAQIHRMYSEKINAVYASENRNRHFLSQWIHNLKTPVAVIDLIIDKTSEEDTSQEALNSIREENTRLRENLDQLLNLIRLNEFSRDFTPEALDLTASVKRVINNKKSQFIYNKVFPKLLLPPQTLVVTDTKWNEFMLEQIVSNAIKYSGKARGEAKDVYFSIETEGPHTSLIIRDEGIGIPEHDLRRIFEPFFTGENGRLYREATGIGLYICSIIAEKLGHRISVTSSPGNGTEVKITYLTKM